MGARYSRGTRIGMVDCAGIVSRRYVGAGYHPRISNQDSLAQADVFLSGRDSLSLGLFLCGQLAISSWAARLDAFCMAGAQEKTSGERNTERIEMVRQNRSCA